jgi:hypothetical protein
VIIAEGPLSFGAASLQQGYVSASRAKRRVDLFVANKEETLDALDHSSERLSAMELVKGKKEAKPLPTDYRQELQAAQRRAEDRIAEKRIALALEKVNAAKEQKLKDELGRHREMEAPKPQQDKSVRKAEPLKAKLGAQREVSASHTVRPTPKPPVEKPREQGKPLITAQLGERKLPVPATPKPQPKQPDLHRGRQPRLLP